MRACMPLLGIAVACAQEPSKAVTAAFRQAAERLPEAAVELQQHQGFGFQRSPDGVRHAWLSLSPAAANGPDRRVLTLHVTKAGAAAPETVTVHAEASGGDFMTAGPRWSPESLAVVVGYHVTNESARTVACVDRLVLPTLAATAVLRREGARIDSLDVAEDGRLAVMVDTGYATVGGGPTQLVVVNTDDTVARTVEIPTSPSFDSAASFARGGKTIAVVSDQGLWFVTENDEPKLCCAIDHESTLAAPPRWQHDGSGVLVAAGGGVVWASPARGLVHAWSAKDVGGRCADVTLLPTNGVGVAVITFDREGGATSVLLGAGHASATTWAAVRLLSLSDGSVEPTLLLESRIADPGRLRLPYLPRISELLCDPR